MQRTILLILAVTVLGMMSIDHAVAQEAKKVEKSVTIKTGKKSGWLGIAIEDVTPKIAREKELKTKEGALINDVTEDSPADSAGLKEGDIVVEFGGTKIEMAEDLVKEVQKTKPGTKVTLTIYRDNDKKSLSVVVGKNPITQIFKRFTVGQRGPHIMIRKYAGIEGMKLSELTGQLAQYFEAPNGTGVLIEEVKKNSSADKAGLKAGDVIIKAGGSTVAKIDDIHESIGEADKGDKMEIEVIRKGQHKTVNLVCADDHDNMMFHFNGNECESMDHEFEINGDAFRIMPEMYLKKLNPKMEELQRKLESMSKQLKIRLPKIPKPCCTDI